MPSEKGRPRGKKRKAVTVVEESESSPLAQEKYVPRFSNKRTRNTRTLSSTPQPAQFEKLRATEPAAADQSGEQLLAIEDETKPRCRDDQATITTVAPGDMEEKATPNSAISFVPGLTLSHGVSSPPTTVPLEADNRAVNTNNISMDKGSTLLSNNARDDQRPGKSDGDEMAAAQDISPGADDDGRNLDLLNPFGDELDTDAESTEQMSSKPAVGKELSQQQQLNQQQQLTGADMFSVAQVTGGGVQQFQQLGSLAAQVVSPNAPVAVLDMDLHAPLPPLSPDATLPSSQDNKELTSPVGEALPESLYDDRCKTSESILCKGSKDDLMSTSKQLLPTAATNSVSELKDAALCEQGEVLSTNIGTQPQTPSQHVVTYSPSDTPALSSAELSLNFTRPKWQRLGEEDEEGEEGGKQEGKHDEFAAVQEMMDLTAADLMMESQLLGGGGDEATVPSCSPASKMLPRRSIAPGSMLLRQPLQYLQDPGAPSEEIGREPEGVEGTVMLRGLIEELSVINRFIMNCKRELDGARKQRQAWLRSQKGRKGR